MRASINLYAILSSHTNRKIARPKAWRHVDCFSRLGNQTTLHLWLFVTHTQASRQRERESQRERDYLLQSAFSSMGTGTSILQNSGSCLALSGIAPIPVIAFFRHLQRSLRASGVSACLNTSWAPAQQEALGASGPKPTKKGVHGTKYLTAAVHSIPASEGLALKAKITNTKANKNRPTIFFSILRRSKDYLSMKYQEHRSKLYL